MRISIDIDDKLLARAMRASGKPTKRAVVTEALQLLIQTKEQVSIRRLRGKVQWEGELQLMRADRLGIHN